VFSVFAGHSHIGEAWAARSNGKMARDYLRVHLDDPSWAEPISAALFQSEDGNEAQLVWSRRKIEAPAK
jgi:uncharacterized protein (DUF736 family)